MSVVTKVGKVVSRFSYYIILTIIIIIVMMSSLLRYNYLYL